MKRIFAAIIAVCAAMVAFAQNKPDGSKVIPFADPFILYEGGVYYLYGTGSGDGIAVAVSKDMKSWEWPQGKEMYVAMHKDDSYGGKWFWAPEVYKVADRYIMYYSAEEHICMAEADSPLGPFRQKVQRPMREHNGIDNHLFIDKNGKPYLFWVNFNSGNQVWVAELEDDLASIVPGTEKFCIAMDQEWEKKWPAVNEGPFVLRHKGRYYMTYSANSYESPDYGVGYAVADSPLGPWVKYEGNPILHRTGGLEGVGHHAFFKDAKGRNRIVFHSHNRPGKIHPRIIHIGTYAFRKVRKAPDLLVIDEEFFTPQMK